jgi:hypothetical protein
MAEQMSRFTIHPSNDPTAMIEFLVRGKDNLVRYAVQAESKARLRDDLASLGVSYETLYHSLESLAKSIREKILESDFDLVRPPHFGAESGSPQ